MSFGTAAKKVLTYVFLMVIVPVGILAAVEGLLRLFPAGSMGIRVGRESFRVPEWILTDQSITSQFGNLTEIPEDIDLEEVFGFWRFFEKDRVFHYRLRPNLNARTVNFFNPLSLKKKVLWTLDSNARGFRGRELAGPKPPGVLRIVSIGDSSTYGWGVEPGEVYTAQLQERLDAKAPGRFEVFNLGVPGHTSFQGRLLARRLRGASPDLVVCSYGSNDGSVSGIDEKTLFARWNSRSGRLILALEELSLTKLLRRVVVSVRDPYRDLKPSDLGPRVSLSDYMENMKAIVATAREMGSAVVFLSMRDDGPYDRAVATVASRERVPLIRFPEIIARNAEAVRSGAAYAEFVARDRALWGAEEYARDPMLTFRVDPIHPNALGHHLIALEIAERMRWGQVLE